ncbi:hypothetical protein Tco_0313549 [Tanacetum coccineum]
MCTYLNNMEGYKFKDLNSKGFDSIQEMFDRVFKRVNTFEDFRTELVKGKEKRAGEDLIQESSKKQKVDDDKETTELKQCLEIIPDEEEVTIDAIPLAVKSPSIVGWKIHKEGRKSYYQIMRADGKSQMYMIFSHMLKSFSREDLEDLYKLVKAKYKSTRPVEDLDLFLLGDSKTIVHSLRMQHVHINMFVEKKYPLIPSALSMMLEKKLQIDYKSEMAYQLLKFIMKHLKNSLYRRHCVVMISILVTPHDSALARCDRLGIAHATGCKGFTDPKTGIWLKRINRKIRIPIDLYPCRVEEKLTMKEVDGEMIMKLETKMIAKDGTVSKFPSKFPGYTPSKEEGEEPEKKG